eukprot:4305035-Prymnesium_polylepis.1
MFGADRTSATVAAECYTAYHVPLTGQSRFGQPNFWGGGPGRGTCNNSWLCTVGAYSAFRLILTHPFKGDKLDRRRGPARKRKLASLDATRNSRSNGTVIENDSH